MSIVEVKGASIGRLARAETFFRGRREEIAVIDPIPEKKYLNAYQINVPNTRSDLFKVRDGILVRNRVEHSGLRNITFSRPDLDGITLDEYILTAEKYTDFRQLVKGNWARISGSSSPKGETLNVAMRSDGSLIFYFGDHIEHYSYIGTVLDFSSYPALLDI